MIDLIPWGESVKCKLGRRKIAAIALVVTIAIPGLFVLLHGGGSPTADLLKTGVRGGAMSGWINDVQAYGGSGHDRWPTMASSGDSVYVAFSRFDSVTGYYRIAVMASSDGGIAWTQVGDLSPGSRDCAYPVMTVFNGILFVAFQYNSSTTDHDIYCFVSSAGATGPWTAYGVRTDANDDLNPTIGAITGVNHAGVYVIFENKRGGVDGTDLLVYKSTGDVFSYANTVVGTSDSSEYTAADISVYQDEFVPILYVAFEMLSGGQHDIYLIRSLNGGATWSSLYQATSNMNDEYAPSVSVGFFYLLISYVMWDGGPDLYAIAWNGAAFGQPRALSTSTDYEGWPEAYNWLDTFYVVYAKGTTYKNGGLYMQSASGAQDPSWGYPSLVSDSSAAADATFRPGLVLCDRPDANFYFATAWGDFRAGTGNSDMYYSTQGCRYTINTNPVGLTYTVDDIAYSSEQTFNWPAGFRHKLTASDGSLPFYSWDDGTNQWYTATINPFALTNDVLGMTANYGAIPEFSVLSLPIIGMVCTIVLSRALRKNGTGIK